MRITPRGRLVGLVALVLGGLLLVLGLNAGRGEAFDEAASRLTGNTGPRLEAAEIQLDTVVQGGGVNPIGRIDPPAGTAMFVDGFDRVRPGAVGTSVIAGHLVHSGKEDVFARVPELGVGDDLTLRAGDQSLTFVVKSTQVTDKAQVTEDDLVWGSNTSTRRLVLITCDDALGFRKDGHRVANYVVVAEAA